MAETTRRTFWLALTALLLTGLIQPFISPPFSWLVFHPVMWIPAFMIFDRVRPWRAFRAGWLIGIIGNALLFHWIMYTVTAFTDLPSILGGLVLFGFALFAGLCPAVFALGFRAVKRIGGPYWPFALATFYTALEFVQPQIFPYFQGVSFYQVPEIFLITAITGVPGVTWLVMATNGVLAQWIEARRDGNLRPAVTSTVILVVALGASLGYCQVRLAAIEESEANAPVERLALVQSDRDDERRDELLGRGRAAIAEDLVSMTREALLADEEIDVVIWPETSLMSHPHTTDNRSVVALMQERSAAGHPVELWTGAYRADTGNNDVQWFNCAFRIKPDAQTDVPYDKMVLVPFGEYVPMGDTFSFLNDIEGIQRMTAGRTVRAYDTPHGRIAFLICYEAIQASFVRESARLEPDLLVNLTYDGWFGTTSEPSQHLMLSAVQAAQYGIPVIRSTTTGVSAVIDARGVIRDHTALGERVVLVTDVARHRVPSLYTRWGDWFAWLCVALAAGMVILSRRK